LVEHRKDEKYMAGKLPVGKLEALSKLSEVKFASLAKR
jgi:hypothetical protein